jgi:plasmid stability protein
VASITIRRLDDNVKARLRVRAAEHGRSMEEEARAILTASLEKEPRGHWVDEIRKIVEPFGGFDLELPPRGPAREPPSFD